MPTPFVSPALDLGELDGRFSRADIKVYGLDHALDSYEGRVFLNNPSATEETAKELDAGYAGSFFVFGHGGCFGDTGHCDLTMPRQYDPRSAHPLWPCDKTVVATAAIRRAIAAGKIVTITIVPVACGPAADDLLRFDNLEILAYV